MTPLNVITDFLTKETLAVLSGIASLVSLFLTIFVLYDTRRIRSFYRFRARGPTLMKELTTCSQHVSEYLNEFEEFIPQIAEELGRSVGKLKSLEGKLSSSPKASVRKLRKAISTCKVSARNEARVREIYIEMVIVVEELKQYQRDLDWEM